MHVSSYEVASRSAACAGAERATSEAWKSPLEEGNRDGKREAQLEPREMFEETRSDSEGGVLSGRERFAPKMKN